MSLRHHTSGNARPWIVTPRPLDASMRRQMHGPVQPMDEPGFLARLFGRRGA